MKNLIFTAALVLLISNILSTQKVNAGLFDNVIQGTVGKVLKEVEKEIDKATGNQKEVEKEIDKATGNQKEKEKSSSATNKKSQNQQSLKLGKYTSQKKSSLPDCKNSPAGGPRLDGKRFPSTRSPEYWGWNNCYGIHRHNYVTKFDHKLLYIGEFKNSVYHGKGTYFETEDEEIFVGEFACGKIVEVEVIYPDGRKENLDMRDELPATCKRELALDKQSKGLDQKENKDMKSMSAIYQNYHPLKLCQKSDMISMKELKTAQEQVNKILKGMFFDFTEPKRSKSAFESLKDFAWDRSILELDKEQTYQMAQFLGLGNKNISRDKRSKLKPMCSAYKGQLDNYENILNMAIREENKKSGKKPKRF